MIVQRNFHNLQTRFRFAALLLMSLSLLSLAGVAQAALFDPGCSNGVGDTAALQTAISTAGSNGAEDTIRLVAGCTYTLTTSLTVNLTDGFALTIEGNNATISGNNSVRVLKILAGSTVNLNRVRLNKGFTDEPGNSDGEGAGIASEGTLTLTNSTVSGSRATSGGGGGILNDQGTLTLIKTKVSGNTLDSGDGAGILNKQGTVTLINSTISGNTASNGGGGIYTDEGTVELTNSTISGNSADWGAGLANLGTMTLTKSVVSGNTTLTGSGGGIDNSGALTLIDSTVSGNSAPESDGGGISSANGGTLTLTGSTVSGNTAGNWGGGIGIFGVGATLTNSTLFNNTASFGGGIAVNSTGTLNLIHITVSGNTSGAINQGGGLYNEGTVAITNTIIANSTTGGDCFNNAGTITPTSVNLVEDGTCSILNAASGDPLLGSPVSQPAYLPLLAGSPALDLGTNDPVNCSATDQRGELRPQDGNHDGLPVCDLGAYELGIVLNGGFEEGTTGWTVSNAATDKVKCDKPTKQVAHGGRCAFLFNGGSGVNGKLTQSLTTITLQSGDSLQLRLFSWGKGSAVSGKVKLKVKYTDGTDPGKLNAVLSGSNGYVELLDDVTIFSAAIGKLKLQISSNSPSGKLYIDDVSLVQSAGTVRLLPLP